MNDWILRCLLEIFRLSIFQPWTAYYYYKCSVHTTIFLLQGQGSNLEPGALEDCFVFVVTWWIEPSSVEYVPFPAMRCLLNFPEVDAVVVVIAIIIIIIIITIIFIRNNIDINHCILNTNFVCTAAMCYLNCPGISL